MKRLFMIAVLLLLPLGGSINAQAADADSFSDGELDQMLAPIALYPDTVLAHVLIAATYPLEVVDASRWVEQNQELEGEAALAAVEDENWDPSVKALVPFPDILARMSEDLDWMRDLGDAFLENEARVMARVQTLRQRAYDEGNLASSEQVTVEREADVIVIEPAVREVIYVPYYDTRVVYGSWWWDGYPPVYWHYPGHIHVSHMRRHHIYWGPRVHVSWNFFFSGFSWHHHHLVVVDRHHLHRDHYRSRHVVHHQHARHWQHNPQHRRGVVYRNPRTRDHFEGRHRVDARQRQTVRYQTEALRSPRTQNVNSLDRWRESDRQRLEVQRRLSKGEENSPTAIIERRETAPTREATQRAIRERNALQNQTAETPRQRVLERREEDIRNVRPQERSTQRIVPNARESLRSSAPTRVPEQKQFRAERQMRQADQNRSMRAAPRAQRLERSAPPKMGGGSARQGDPRSRD